jgi:hypothetical protein
MRVTPDPAEGRADLFRDSIPLPPRALVAVERQAREAAVRRGHVRETLWRPLASSCLSRTPRHISLDVSARRHRQPDAVPISTSGA